MYIRIFSYIYIIRDTKWQLSNLIIIETTPEIKYISRNSKYYHEKVKANEQKRTEEKERIRAYNKDKYQNDEVYKQYKREQALKNYYKKKNVAAVLQTV